MPRPYDSITYGDKISEEFLAQENPHVHNNSFVGVPTGETIPDEGAELEIKSLTDYQNESPSYINGKQQGTVFGADAVVANEVPVEASKFNMGIPIKGLEARFVGNAYVECGSNNTLDLHSGTDANASVEVNSLQRIRYEAGSPGYKKITIGFVDPADTNGDLDCAFGLWDGDDGYIFKEEIRNGEATYYFDVYKSGVIDKHNSINGVQDFDFYVLSIYRIVYGYLGVAPTEIYRMNTLKRVFEEVHRQLYSQRETSLDVPELPIGGYIKNLGNTNDVMISTGSIQVGIIDGATSRKGDPNSRVKAAETAITVVSGTTSVWAFQNPENVDMYDRLDISGIPRIKSYKNVVSSDLLSVGYAVDTNKIVVLKIYITPIANVTGTFTSVDLGWSVLSVSDNPVVVDRSDLELIRVASLGRLNSDEIEVIRETLLMPGFTAVFETETTGAGELDLNIIYQDLF